MKIPGAFENRVNNSELFRNISTLAAGTALAQLIPILLQPILRRYYAPEAFGSYTVYLSIVGILIIISSLKYELAIIMPRSDKHAVNLFFLTVGLSFVFNLTMLLIILIWKAVFLDFLNIPEKFASALYFIPLGTFLYSYYQSANYCLIRKKRFMAITRNKFIRRGSEGASQVGFKFINASYGLIWGDLVGHVTNVISVTYQVMKIGIRINLASHNKIRYVFRKYIDYPKFNVIPSFMSACSYLLPAILINKFYTPENAGYFDLTKLVLSIPFALIATSISNVLLQSVSEKFKKGESFIKELKPILAVVTVIAGLEIAVILLFGVDLFVLVFGDVWEVSGQISRILIWSFVLNFVVGSFGSIFIAMGKIRILSLWQLVYFMAILSLLFFKAYGFVDFLRVYVIIEVVCYILISLLLIVLITGYETKIRHH